MPYALLIFVAMPIIEIAVLLKVGDALGWFPTLGVVILTAVVGTAMLRQQGIATLNIARQRLNSGEMPAQQIVEGIMLLVGGVLLLTPGFVTDAFGFICLVPLSRRWLARRIAARSAVGFSGSGGFMGGIVNMDSRQAKNGEYGTHVGSGSTSDGAANDQSSAASPAGGVPNGTQSSGKPQTAPSDKIIEADFKRIDD